MSFTIAFSPRGAKKAEKLVFLIFLIVGLVLIAAGVIAEAVQQRVIAKSDPVTAVISEIETRHNGDDTIWVSYQYQGADYRAPLHYYSSSMYEGQELTVYVSPDHPESAYYKNYLLSGIFAGIGLLFLLIGLVFLTVFARSKKRIQRILTDGRPLDAPVIRVEQNTRYRVNGASPYRVFCQYTDPVSGVQHLFHSDNLWFDPRPYLGDSLRVYIDGENYRRYAVDTAPLESLFQQRESFKRV